MLPETVTSIIRHPARLDVLACFVPKPWHREKEFAVISDLLASICDVPIALVTVVDEEQQFFVGKTGTDETGNKTELSFCAHTIAHAGSGPFVVTDLLSDPRFADHPLVENDPKIRFYAGAAVFIDHEPVGTVCVIDVKPHPDFGADKLVHLQRFATLAGSILELKEGTRRGQLSETSRLRSERRHRMALTASNIATWEWDLNTGIVEGDDNLKTMFDLQKDGSFDVQDLFSAMTHEDRIRTEDIVTSALATGSEFEIEFQIANTGRWLIGIGQFFEHDKNGKPTRAVGVNIDATEKKRQEQHSRFMLREINHRVKNTLAILQSLAAQTLRRSHSAEQFMAAFSGRLQSIAAAHTILSDSEWGAIHLRGIIDVQVRPFGNDKAEAIQVSGPDIDLEPDEALGLSMILHELATNAHKYGALKMPNGYVQIELALNTPADMIEVTWQEVNGPKVESPDNKGFGSILIERSLDKVIGSKVDINYGDSGLRAVISIPANGRRADALD